MKTVHIILNAHLDPVWLWSWRNGLDEVLNSSYAICDTLDRHPDIKYSRGEAWVYEQIKNLDPQLFARIKRHVKAGRWNIVGGWYLQPDCNLPSGFAMERQIALGREFFLREFGKFPHVAYNVDSFGHAATLPGYMRSAGQTCYVMMRPQENEMTLPARIFRWQGYKGGPEVTTFRIAKAYNTSDLTEELINASLTELPKGVTNTMCFAGIGDHGGGPTEELIDWCRSHAKSFPGIRLQFSSPVDFFKGIRRDFAKLPIVVGELQHHAIGCYTVHRPVKVGVRRAEHRLRQAEIVNGNDQLLKDSWKRICFNHFHDTYGGSCLPSAYEDVHSELGSALAAADESATMGLRKRTVKLPPDKHQRLVLFQASEHPFDDYLEVEPWIEWSKWQPTWGLKDEKGRRVPLQVMKPETTSDSQFRLVFPTTIQPGKIHTLRIVDYGVEAPEPKGAVKAVGDSLKGESSIHLRGSGSLSFGGKKFPLPKLVLSDDETDTWSHGVDRYARKNPEFPKWSAPEILDNGPLMAALGQRGRIGSSELMAEWRIYHGRPWVELKLRVVWVEKRRLLKMEWKPSGGISGREDGIMGGSLKRKSDGRERPMRDWTILFPKAGKTSLAVVAPEVFALSGDDRHVGLTLLRSCPMACHEPNTGQHMRTVFSDQGFHEFRFRFLAGSHVKSDFLDEISLNLQRTPLNAEVTRGMKAREKAEKYKPLRP